MKILCACDRAITPNMVMGMKQELERLGNTFEIFDNKALHSTTAMAELMLKTEVEGPESVDADPVFLPLVKDVEILITHMTVVNKAVIDSAPKLKLAVVMRGGCDNVNVDYLHQKKILTINASWRSSYAVADFTVGMMLAETKNIARGYRYLCEGRWERSYPNSVTNLHDLRNRTVGLIGFGFIGQRVAKYLSGFECKIMIHDPFLTSEVIRSKGYTPYTLEELLKNCDIISMHLRYSEKTKHFLAKKHFTMMKPTAFFINTARAGLVEEEALLDALKSKKIQGAAIDVYNVEPLPKDNPYIKLDNVTLTPHMAGVSNDTMTNSVEIVFDDLKRYFNGEQVQCVV